MIRIVLFLITIALVLNFSPSSTDAGARILVIGDSISRGAYASNQAATYVAQVATALRATRHTAVQPTRDLTGAEMVWTRVADRSWSIIILEIGINDTLSGDIDSDWETRYAALVAQFRATGATVVCVTPFDIGVAERAADLAARTMSIRESCQGGRVADAYFATVGRSNLRANVGDLTFYEAQASDALHPNDVGHAVIASLVLNALRQRVYLPLV